MRKVLEKLYDLLSSWRLAVWLIISFLVIVTAGQIPTETEIHNPGVVAKTIAALGLRDTYTSWPFLALVCLLVFNISICMAKRIKILFADRPGDESLLWSRRQVPMLGSLVFHLSFLVIIAGGCYSAATRMEGITYITEGQSVIDTHDSYTSLTEAPLFFESHGLFKLYLKNVSMKFDGNRISDFYGRITVTDREHSFDHDIRVNSPLIYKNTSFILKRYGFAPLFILKDAAGREIFRSYVKISSEKEINEDLFRIGDTGLSVDVKLSPDAEVVDGELSHKSSKLINPLMELQVDREIKGGKLRDRVFKGFMKPGDTAEFNDYTLTFGDLRYWLQLDVAKDTGQPILFAGFWIAVAGIAIRFLGIFGLRPLSFMEDGGKVLLTERRDESDAD